MPSRMKKDRVRAQRAAKTRADAPVIDHIVAGTDANDLIKARFQQEVREQAGVNLPLDRIAVADVPFTREQRHADDDWLTFASVCFGALGDTVYMEERIRVLTFTQTVYLQHAFMNDAFQRWGVVDGPPTKVVGVRRSRQCRHHLVETGPEETWRCVSKWRECERDIVSVHMVPTVVADAVKSGAHCDWPSSPSLPSLGREQLALMLTNAASGNIAVRSLWRADKPSYHLLPAEYAALPQEFWYRLLLRPPYHCSLEDWSRATSSGLQVALDGHGPLRPLLVSPLQPKAGTDELEILTMLSLQEFMDAGNWLEAALACSVAPLVPASIPRGPQHG